MRITKGLLQDNPWVSQLGPRFNEELPNRCYASWGEDDKLRTDMVVQSFTLNKIDARPSSKVLSTRCFCRNTETLLLERVS